MGRAIATDVVACQICGGRTDKNVSVREAYNYNGSRNAQHEFRIGLCPDCERFEVLRPGSAVRAALALIGKPIDQDREFAPILAEAGVEATQAIFELTGQPKQGPVKPWSFVTKDFKSQLRACYAILLEDRIEAGEPPLPEPPPFGLACIACGLGEQVEPWRGPIRSHTLTRGPDPVEGYACSQCAAVLESVGSVGPTWLEKACLTSFGREWKQGITLPGLKPWVATGLRPGTQRWCWVDLRDMEPPKDAVDLLTDRVAALEAVLAKAGLLP